MDDFYRTAVQHLAPQLVMDVLDGRNPSFKDAFKKEVDSAINALHVAVQKAGAKLLANGYNLQSGLELVWQNSRITSFHLFNNGRDNLGLSPVMTYLLLPEIA